MPACHHGRLARSTRQRAAGDPVGPSTVDRAIQVLADDGHTPEIFGTCFACRSAGTTQADAPPQRTSA